MFDRYMELIGNHPELFANTGEKNELKIITDKDVIEREHRILCMKLKQNNQPHFWANIGVLSEDEWYLTIRDLVLFPDGNYNGYIRFINKKFWFDNAPSVYILPYYNGMVLLTRQYRHQERKFIWETPRGFGENGQSSEQSAIRELKEEIGVEPVELIRLTNPDNNGDSIFFFARLFDEHITLSDPHEGLAGFKFMSISQFELMIINGTISDKNTIILYTLSKLKNLI